MSDFRLETVESDSGTAHLVTTGAVNWVILREGSDLTLIDGGYPGQASTVVSSIREIGAQPEDIRGALLTHAHVDHLLSLIHISEPTRPY